VVELRAAVVDPDPPVPVSADVRLATMVREHFTFVWRLLRRLGVPADRADDAAQEVFLVASKRILDVVVGSERSFLFGTALRVAKSARRAMGHEPPVETDDAPDSTPQLDELTDRKRAREMLDHILAAMDDSLRVVFVLYEIEGMTTPEIAELIGAPLGTAASRLRRAREEFEAHVRRIEARGRSGRSQQGGTP
jgi:RNA polymerase sigma-70 factor, ECF subfamily